MRWSGEGRSWPGDGDHRGDRGRTHPPEDQLTEAKLTRDLRNAEEGRELRELRLTAQDTTQIGAAGERDQNCGISMACKNTCSPSFHPDNL